MDKNKLIKKIIELSFKSKEGHLGSSLSVLDILYILYRDFLPKQINKQQRYNYNRLILSKGHASLGLYAVLDHFKYLEEEVNNFCNFTSKIGGHPSNKLQAVEASTGSLGHGLPIGVGMAIGYRINNNTTSQIYVIVGDGEMNEGSNWEALLLAANHKLNNLTCIIDYNRSNDRALKLDNLYEKINAFNWNCIEIDGHSYNEIRQALYARHDTAPTCVIAHTIKGYGVPMMENNPEWHHKAPNNEEYKKIIESL